jgi:hypothetical protein
MRGSGERPPCYSGLAPGVTSRIHATTPSVEEGREPASLSLVALDVSSETALASLAECGWLQGRPVRSRRMRFGLAEATLTWFIWWDRQTSGPAELHQPDCCKIYGVTRQHDG